MTEQHRRQRASDRNPFAALTTWVGILIGAVGCSVPIVLWWANSLADDGRDSERLASVERASSMVMQHETEITTLKAQLVMLIGTVGRMEGKLDRLIDQRAHLGGTAIE